MPPSEQMDITSVQDSLSKEKALKYDVSGKIISYLDPHLAFRLLKLLQQKQIYPEGDIKRAKMEVLTKTYMIDEAKDIYEELNPGAQDHGGLDEKRQGIVTRLTTIKDRVQGVLKVVEDEQLLNKLREENNLTLAFLKEEYDISEEEVEELYAHAKARFECGDYSGAGYYLEVYRRLHPDGANARAALWGQLAAQMLVPDWEQATELLQVVRDVVDHDNDVMMQMQRRVWLLHWSLFVLAQHSAARNVVIDLFSHNLQALLTLAPHLLRHFVVTVISKKRRLQQVVDLLKPALQHERDNTDPTVQFAVKLLLEYDFDGALGILGDCRDAIRADLFLDGLVDEFVEGAKYVLCENYCRLHHVVDLKVLASKLEMDIASAEQFMANVIRGSKMHAKIDSNRNYILVDIPPPNVYQQVLQRVEDIQHRSSNLRSLLLQQTQPSGGKKYTTGGKKHGGKSTPVKRK